jgi:hypothetical protein
MQYKQLKNKYLTMPGRIPINPDEFSKYIVNGDNYLNETELETPNWMRLCLTLIIAGLWHAQRVAWDLLYAKYSDPTKRTKPVEAAVEAFILAFKVVAQPWLNIMAACPGATTDDEIMFNFVRDNNHAAPVHHEVPISANMFAVTEAMGGQKVKTKGRTSTLSKKAGMPHDQGVDGVRKSWAISEKANDGPDNQDSPGTTKEFTTGATSILELPADSSGKYLNSWDQWYDSKHPKRAGVWSKKTVTMIV